MAGLMGSDPVLSVIIPCLNEAAHLPLLLADLDRWPGALERLVIDAGSEDGSADLARRAGAHCLLAPQRGRGAQLAFGADQARGAWLLFLHADSRLSSRWPQAVMAVLNEPADMQAAWYFDLRLQPSRPGLRLLSTAVAMRSRWLQRPYGDQGLLLHRRLYAACGGYAALPLMEDLDLVERLSAKARLRALDDALISDSRRWSDTGLIQQSWRNAQLRSRWRRGENPDRLASAYYGRPNDVPADQEAYQKPQRWPWGSNSQPSRS